MVPDDSYWAHLIYTYLSQLLNLLQSKLYSPTCHNSSLAKQKPGMSLMSPECHREQDRTCILLDKAPHSTLATVLSQQLRPSLLLSLLLLLPTMAAAQDLSSSLSLPTSLLLFFHSAIPTLCVLHHLNHSGPSIPFAWGLPQRCGRAKQRHLQSSWDLGKFSSAEGTKRGGCGRGTLAIILPITCEGLACRTQQSRRLKDFERSPEAASEPLAPTMPEACYPHTYEYLHNNFPASLFWHNLVSGRFLLLITKSPHKCIYSKLCHS